MRVQSHIPETGAFSLTSWRLNAFSLTGSWRLNAFSLTGLWRLNAHSVSHRCETERVQSPRSRRLNAHSVSHPGDWRVESHIPETRQFSLTIVETERVQSHGIVETERAFSLHDPVRLNAFSLTGSRRLNAHSVSAIP